MVDAALFLGRRGPDEPAWTFWPDDQTCAFWFRRMAHETVVHRVDAELAAGEVTPVEDWAACESVQRGAESPHFRPGPLAPAEDAVYQWVTMVARGYLGKSLAP
jgi:hypothetical protein